MNTGTASAIASHIAGIVYQMRVAYPATQAIYLNGTWDNEHQRQDSDLDIAVQLPETAARSVERNQAQLYDVSYIEVKPHAHYPPDKGRQEGFPPDKGGQGGAFPEKRAQRGPKRDFPLYNPTLINKARQNRKNPTPAENKLWCDVLQGKRFAGLKFTRQKPIDDYIVDFYCAELMLAIEVDGDTHATRQQYDQLRTQRLKRLGVEVIRYTNSDVLNDLEGVGADLLGRVEGRQPPKSPFSGGLALVAVELTDFSVHYSQDSNAEASLKNGKNKIIAEAGQIVRVSKDKTGKINPPERLTKHWTDWIDYWAVDFDFESKREIIRVRNEDTGKIEEQWSGDYVFENEWQSFRTKKDRDLELTSVAQECPRGRRKIAVKVVDIFGNDTMKIVEVNV